MLNLLLLTSGVSHIFFTDAGFAALKTTDQLSPGGRNHGCFNSDVADDLTSGVVTFADPFHDDRLVEDSLSLTIDATAPADINGRSCCIINTGSSRLFIQQQHP